MRIKQSPRTWLLAAVYLTLVVFVAVTFASGKLRNSLPSSITMGNPLSTVLPARIDPCRQMNIVSQHGSHVVQVHVQQGAQVKTGELLVTLESDELTEQVRAAERRFAIAGTRLREARSGSNSAQSKEARKERLAAATRDRQSARERLEAFSIKTQDDGVKKAQKRAADLRILMQKGYATGTEVETAQNAEQAALRELATAREHLSRLRQEVAASESLVRLLELDPDGESASGVSLTSLQADYEDANSAVDATRRRADSLRVTAPANGTVLEISVRAGDWTASGATIARLADVSRLILSVPVTAKLAQRTATGSQVLVRLPTEPPQQLKASVSGVNLTPDSTQHAYLISVVIPNPNPSVILAGLEAEVEFPHAWLKNVQDQARQ